MKVVFNLNMIFDFINSNTDSFMLETIQAALKDFVDYADCVKNFAKSKNALKGRYTGSNYRQASAKLDQDRRYLHDSVLADCKLFNRICQKQHYQPLFCIAAQGAQRSDYTKAVMNNIDWPSLYERAKQAYLNAKQDQDSEKENY